MGNTNSGRGGLPHAKRREVERLLVDGRLKNAQIARACGVDVSTVSRYKRRLRERGASSEERGASGEEPENVRCGSCGGLLVPTAEYCLACYQEKTIFAPRRRARRRAA